jgi:esterase
MKLYFKKLGKGRPLFILHGLFGMSDNWCTIAKRIAKKHTVYLVDQRNHGQSPHSAEFDYNLLATDLEELIRDLRLDTIRIIGHSMGGKVAMNYALKYPDRLEKLVVVDIAPKQYSHPFFKDVLKLMVNLDLSRFDSRGEIDEAFRPVVKSAAVRQFIMKNVYREDDNTFSWKLNVNSLHANLDKIFGAIQQGRIYTQPSLFVRGGNSDYVLVEDEPLIKQFFPAAKIVTIPGASHWLHVEAEETFCDQLKAYL